MLELLFPALCAACGARVHHETPICHDCLGKLKYLAPPWCSRCGIPQNHTELCFDCSQRISKTGSLDQIRSVFIYQEPLRIFIHQWKYKDRPELSRFLAQQMVLFTELYFTEKPWDILIPVPLHKTRERERDYNQSLLLAAAVSKALEIPVSTGTLKRARPTLPQSTLPEPERRSNVLSAFRALSYGAAKKNILLIDDLYTTGSTLEQCAFALKTQGAARVDALTLSRTMTAI
ncbi:MAG: ComF family protein [Candidatus Omnitrophica bacterium]|nr:ComF family protein [Candidatus Omnitrophota bacterium]